MHDGLSKSILDMYFNVFALKIKAFLVMLILF